MPAERGIVAPDQATAADIDTVATLKSQAEYLKKLRAIAEAKPLLGHSGRQTVLIRALDLVLALIAAVLSAPLLLLIAAAVKASSPGPVFFTQQRLGQYQRPFLLIKFRTMVSDAEAAGPAWSSADDQRITPIGRWLRKSRFDELPQLYNILVGDLCFVGPRPIRKHFADLLAEHDPRYPCRFLIKPGLTGWAQLYAPYGSTIDEQLEKLPYDLRYCEKPLTLWDYFRLIAATAKSVLLGKGV